MQNDFKPISWSKILQDTSIPEWPLSAWLMNYMECINRACTGCCCVQHETSYCMVMVLQDLPELSGYLDETEPARNLTVICRNVVHASSVVEIEFMLFSASVQHLKALNVFAAHWLSVDCWHSLLANWNARILKLWESWLQRSLSVGRDVQAVHRHTQQCEVASWMAQVHILKDLEDLSTAYIHACWDP